MKLITLLPLAALGTAFVIVEEALFNQIPVESQHKSKTFFEKLPSKSDIFSHVEGAFDVVFSFSENAIDKAINAVSEATETVESSFKCHSSMTAFDAKAWLDESTVAVPDVKLVQDRPRHPPHKKPHHHKKPNQTIYELISSSKYTTKLAKLISEFDDLVDILNGTSANYTLFAPIDAAFEKIPKHGKKPSKELIRNILAYHVSPDFYPAGRVLVTHTIPSAYHEERLGGEPQRLRVGFGLFKGLNINFFSRIIAVDIFATNGVIHGVDSLILPPPPALKIIELLPGEFSTLQLALTKTGLFDDIKDSTHTGGTLFAPSNEAFKKLGPKLNAFLFSKFGEKYLKALLKYHIVANQTLYSDAFYKAKDATNAVDEIDAENIPKGHFHLDLPTLLYGRSLSIDIARFGGFITIKINGFATVAVQDGLASDGVVQVVSNILIPPKVPKGAAYSGEELTVEDLKERLDVFVEEEEEKKKTGWWEL